MLPPSFSHWTHREGFPAYLFPKSRHCLDGVGVWPLPGFFLKDWSTCTEGPQRLSFITKKWHLPHKSAPYSPEKIIQPHLFDIFTLKHDLRTFVEKNVAVASTHFYGPNHSGCLDWGVGWGGQPYLGNVCILGTNSPALPPLYVKDDI